MYDINYRRKRVREEISEGADADDTEDHSLFRFKNYWPVADPADNDSSTRYNVMWYDYPFLPQSHILSCDDEIFYEPEIPDDLSTVQRYSRADFWNLSPWIGPPLVWALVTALVLKSDRTQRLGSTNVRLHAISYRTGHFAGQIHRLSARARP